MKALVIGLDSAPPELLFNRFLDHMPHIRRLLRDSLYGPMQSTIPAITIPAWIAMATGKTPGELGLYGFRHRRAGTYNDVWIANSSSIRERAVWDYLGEKGYRSVLVGVPPTYPPKKINGWLISDFITPDASVDYTYPRDLKREVERVAGEYIFDVPFRTDDKESVRDGVWEMTERRFEVIKYLMQEKDWDYFQFVEIGLDRIHHAFWRYFDRSHHLYEWDNRFERVIPEYYRLLDKKIGELLKLVDLDETAVFIVSDHGIQAMRGAFAINQFFYEEGFLKLRGEPEPGTPIQKADVDWSRTLFWGWGGYYSRVFLNVRGREPQGRIPLREYERAREDLAELLKSIRGPNGERWSTEVFFPERIYPEARGDRPDLMVYFDNLRWRALGTLGWDSPYRTENDKGPDDAVHSEYGVFALRLPEPQPGHVLCKIYDFAPTVLSLFGIRADLRGRSLVG